MKKKQLEIQLERLMGFSNPSAEKEQYATPASVAADLLYLAYLHGDLECVCDLGCGTGVLAIGSALLGAKVVGVEIDPKSLMTARENATRLGVEVEFIRGDANSVSLKGIKTVVMNPPFGAQKASAGDRAFLRKAVEIANVVYSIHNLGSEGFIRRIVEPCTIEEIYRIKFPLRRCFAFHSRDVKIIEVELYRIACRRNGATRQE
jgi:putative methylase